ncbi:MAG: NAD-dependent DNA ligase LigA [Eubacteriales bacterium]
MIEEEMKRLIESLNSFNYHYYTLDSPIVSDAEYDELYDKLVRLEKQSGVVLENSPTRRVGGNVLTQFEKHTHLSPLYSLDKVKTQQDLKAFYIRNEKILNKKSDYVVEYKFDGLTVNLTYDGGYLRQAATRGDGVTGEGILAQVKNIKSVVKKIPFTGRMEVQGEAIIHLSDLEKINNEEDIKFKNARNAAAGALRNLDPGVAKKRKIDIYFYSIGYIEGKSFDTHIEMIKFLRECGFKLSPFIKLVPDVNEAINAIKEIEETRFDLDFLIDGAVLKLNDMADRLSLGATEKFPRWAVAYKFSAEEKTTKLLDVTWEVGRTGKLTPKAHLEPVDIGGATVKNATLNNYGDILKKDIKIGSKVFIRRSNDVIPEITGVAQHYPDSKKIVPPKFCPACGKEIVRDGANIFCNNSLYCVPQLTARMAHFAERGAMDITDVSEKTIGVLIGKLGAKDVSALYFIDYDKLLKIRGFKEKKVSKLKEAIEKSKTPRLSNFLYALGIPGVGKATAKSLAKRFLSFEAFENTTLEDLVAVKDVGLLTARGIRAFLEDEKNKEILRRLFRAGVSPRKETSDKNGKLFGKKFVLTGTLETMTREEATKVIEREGGSVSSSVTKDTFAVICGEKPGSKLDKAKKNAVTVLDEKEFLSLLDL